MSAVEVSEKRDVMLVWSCKARLVYFHSVRVTRAPLDEGEKEAPPRSSTRKRKREAPRASRRSMPPAPATLFPEHGGGGAGAARRRAVDGRLQTG
ncbi:hypothetical protein MTO96_043065 [Rhipicephalus appendiculatus]